MARTLICITSCERLTAVKALAAAYARFCVGREDYDLLIAVDGDDGDYRRFAEAVGLPLLWGTTRAGVGITKNRVVACFPDYDGYFFVEDDVELLDPGLFDLHLAAAATGIHHLSLHPVARLLDRLGTTKAAGHTLVHASYGSAQLSYYSRRCFQAVGGFHPEFATHLRYGHTEHSWRIWRAGLAPAPFNVLAGCVEGYCYWHDPAHVTEAHSDGDRHGITRPERELMTKELSCIPLETVGRPHFNGVTLTTDGLDGLARAAVLAAPVFYRSVIDAGRARERSLRGQIDGLVGGRPYRLGNGLLEPLRRARRAVLRRPDE